MKLAHIKIDSIHPNPENPRGIEIQTQDTKLAYLKESISKFGVMVPIVVAKRDDGYILIDGERRYWASRALSIKTIPAFILDEGGSLSDDALLFRMFQIHHNHEQWGAIQQCRALEGTYKKICGKEEIRRIQDEKAKLKAIGEELVNETGIEERTAFSRILFLRWPEKTKRKIYIEPGEQFWYICEIEEKIIIPAMINYPEYFQKVDVNEVRDDLFEKLARNAVDKAVDVRRVAPFFRKEMPTDSDRNKLKKIFAQMHKNKNLTYAEVQDELTQAFPSFITRDPVSPRKMHSNLHNLKTAIEDFDVSSIESASKRAKATRGELISELEEVIVVLNQFLAELKEGE